MSIPFCIYWRTQQLYWLMAAIPNCRLKKGFIWDRGEAEVCRKLRVVFDEGEDPLQRRSCKRPPLTSNVIIDLICEGLSVSEQAEGDVEIFGICIPDEPLIVDRPDLADRRVWRKDLPYPKLAWIRVPTGLRVHEIIRRSHHVQDLRIAFDRVAIA